MSLGCETDGVGDTSSTSNRDHGLNHIRRFGACGVHDEAAALSNHGIRTIQGLTTTSNIDTIHRLSQSRISHQERSTHRTGRSRDNGVRASMRGIRVKLGVDQLKQDSPHRTIDQHALAGDIVKGRHNVFTEVLRDLQAKRCVHQETRRLVGVTLTTSIDRCRSNGPNLACVVTAPVVVAHELATHLFEIKTDQVAASQTFQNLLVQG
mmetsp:Transcript_50313/g.75176  ORF Transcript_50313/g.75176 Transcript_50313/m.75176 type:complete len:208 (+) Transcript_50313:264-887(+)